MIRNVTEYLDAAAEKCPDKMAFDDGRRALSFRRLREETDHVAAALIALGIRKQPVAVFLDRSVECIPAFMGAAKSGNFYSPIDTAMPAGRIGKIMDTLQPAVVITDEAHQELARSFAGQSQVLLYERLQQSEIRPAELRQAAEAVLDADLLYVLFTSGSTGTPKGVMISQRGVIDFTEWAAERFGVDDTYIFGMQAPFYFSGHIWEIYLTLKCAASTHILPSELFSYPGDLMNYLAERKINIIVWVPTALCMLSQFRVLNHPHLEALRNVWFGGEAMPIKQLNKWRKEYPDVRYVNVYGATEVVDTCTSYEVCRPMDDSELLPIGEACRNTEILLLNERDELAARDEIGELCVRGSALSYGYYRDPARTEEVFVQNPLNRVYKEIIYRTGDLVKYNDHGELVYVSRKDFQIKHMGRRIELGEIEAVLSAVEGIENSCCLYDKKRSRICAFYSGSIEDAALQEKLRALLPEYMLPGKRIRMEEMPLNLNKKIDRPKLQALLDGE